MSRIVRKPVTFFGFAVLLLAVPIWWRLRAPTLLALVHAQGPAHATNLEVDTIRAGLDARALAAAGVSAQGTSTLVQAVDQHLLAHPADLSVADEAYATARRETDRLQRLIQSGHGNEQDVSSYQTQKAALAAATAQRQTALDAIFEAATSGLTQAQRVALTKIRANRNWTLAVEFLAVDRSETDWVRVREALANERISSEDNVALDPQVAAQIAAWRADPAVSSAAASLGANLVSVTSAWNAAMHD